MLTILFMIILGTDRKEIEICYVLGVLSIILFGLIIRMVVFAIDACCRYNRVRQNQ